MTKQEPWKPVISPVVTRILENQKYVKFLAKQKAFTNVYFPEEAERTAREMMSLVKQIADPARIRKFNPYVAVKSCNNEVTLARILQLFGADVASLAEEKYVCRIAKKFGVNPPIACSNMWLGKKEVRALVLRGNVTNIVVDKKHVIRWIAQAEQQRKQKYGPRPYGEELTVTLRVTLTNKGVDQGDKFGAQPYQLRELAECAKAEGLPVAGVACHSGTQNSVLNECPRAYGIDKPRVGRGKLILNYRKAVLEVAAVCNELHALGLIGPEFNTEGGYRVAYLYPEYDWRSVIRLQVETIQKAFQYPVIWKNEPGRLFSPCAVMKAKVANVDLDPRSPDGIPYVSIIGPYSGLHDSHWEGYTVVRQKDVLRGHIYTYDKNPEMFSDYHWVGLTCAGSDAVGSRFGWTRIPMPKDLQPGETVWILCTGSYTSSLLPQAYLEVLYGIYGLGRKLHGFNGIKLVETVSYQEKKKKGHKSKKNGKGIFNEKHDLRKFSEKKLRIQIKNQDQSKDKKKKGKKSKKNLKITIKL